MRTNAIKITAIIIAAIFLLGSLLPLFLSSVSADTLQQQIDQQQQKQDNLQQEINDIKNQKSTIMTEKEQLDKEIDQIQANMDELSSQISSLDQQITTTQQEIDDLTVKIDNQYETYKERVRVSYEQGPVSYLDVLFSSNSFSDFLNRYEIIKQIAAYDKTILSELEANQQTVEEKKTDLVNQKEERETKYSQYDVVKTDINNKIAARDELMNELNQTQEEKEQALAEAEAAEKQLKAQLAAQSTNTSASGAKYVGGTFQWPVPGYYTITDPFGYRIHPTTGVYKMHTGTDIAVSYGVPVLAMNSGTVILAGYNVAYGNYIIIDHGGGYRTLYAHSSKLLVSQGQQVERGQQIMLVGSSGYSTGPHLHMEIIKDGVETNPMSYFN